MPFTFFELTNVLALITVGHGTISVWLILITKSTLVRRSVNVITHALIDFSSMKFAYISTTIFCFHFSNAVQKVIHKFTLVACSIIPSLNSLPASFVVDKFTLMGIQVRYYTYPLTIKHVIKEVACEYYTVGSGTFSFTMKLVINKIALVYCSIFMSINALSIELLLIPLTFVTISILPNLFSIRILIICKLACELISVIIP